MVFAMYRKNNLVMLESRKTKEFKIPSGCFSDFRLQLDPVFGNCYTFNWNLSTNLSSNRAGAMYGLRMIVFVNNTEYMRTTEAGGVRITVHEKSQYPFPDTFGYNAPTGFISSFGLRNKRMERLPAPYGTCVKDGNVANYIFSGYSYSVEGCHRSCFQNSLVKSCGCGDPRFPLLPGSSHCLPGDYERSKACTEYLFWRI